MNKTLQIHVYELLKDIARTIENIDSTQYENVKAFQQDVVGLIEYLNTSISDLTKGKKID